MNSLTISNLGLQKTIAEFEILRLTLEKREQTSNIVNAISCLQMAEDWLKDECEE